MRFGRPGLRLRLRHRLPLHQGALPHRCQDHGAIKRERKCQGNYKSQRNSHKRIQIILFFFTFSDRFDLVPPDRRAGQVLQLYPSRRLRRHRPGGRRAQHHHLAGDHKVRKNINISGIFPTRFAQLFQDQATRCYRGGGGRGPHPQHLVPGQVLPLLRRRQRRRRGGERKGPWEGMIDFAQIDPLLIS